MLYDNNEVRARGFGELGEMGIYFSGTGEQRPNFERNKDNIGEQGTKENKFSNFGEQGNKPIYSRGGGEGTLDCLINDLCHFLIIFSK